MRAVVLAAMVASVVPAIPASGTLDVAAIDVLGSASSGGLGPVPTQVEFYQEGNRLYQEGDFEGALASYLRLVEAGFESAKSTTTSATRILSSGMSPHRSCTTSVPAGCSPGMKTFKPTSILRGP